MKELTKAEEQVMQILWKLEKGFVKDIIGEMNDPKPAYNTVSTITRILEKKGFVDHKAYGNAHQYFPVISKEHYTRDYMNRFVKNYFSNSFEKMVSFFSSQNSLDMEEMDRIIRMMEELKNKQKEK